MTLGSLFDGISGFPLAGLMNGIETKWISEIEPFCIKVSSARFPNAKQLGSVTDIDGGAVEPVDIITFGSPCQDLSVAGKQLGIHEGQRSNLFFEAVRIIKEMRNADTANGRSGVDIRPRFAVWENVPGAFSSNKGADFKAVLEALASVRENGVSIPQPKKWGGAGCVVGNGWSVAWRVYDAQYWGVPQRRKRIYLVADFAGERAPEILFERESVRGNPAAGGEAGEGAAADAEGGVGGSGGVRCLNPWDSQSIRQYDVNGVAPNINANSHGGQNRWGVCYPAAFMGGQGAKARSVGYCDDGTTPTLRAAESGSNQVPDVCYPTIAFTERGRDGGRSCETQDDVFYALTNPGDGGRSQSRMVCYPAMARALTARHDSSPCVDRGQNVVALDCRNMTGNEELSGTLQAKNDGGFSLNFVNPVVYAQQRIGQYAQDTIGSTEMARDYKSAKDLVVESSDPPRKYIVRRLTPTECARLQGFPDEWCEGMGGSDSAIYKAYGNGLALPCAYDVMQRIARFVEREAASNEAQARGMR